MLAAHPVRRAAHPKGERREAEQLRLVARADAAQIQELLARQPELVPVALAEAALDERGDELVVARGDGRVGGERAAAAHLARRVCKILAALRSFARQLQSQKRRVALVQVEDMRPDAELPKQTDAPYP